MGTIRNEAVEITATSLGGNGLKLNIEWKYRKKLQRANMKFSRGL